MCWRTVTNGSHSDYQVRTWFVLFAPNLPSCRHDKEGRALSYTVFSTDWRPTGTSDWGAVPSIWLSAKGPSWENHIDETWEVLKSQNYFFRSDRGQPYKHFAWYLTGFIYYIGTIIVCAESEGFDSKMIFSSVTPDTDRYIPEYLPRILLVSSDSKIFPVDVKITKNLLDHLRCRISPKSFNQQNYVTECFTKYKFPLGLVCYKTN